MGVRALVLAVVLCTSSIAHALVINYDNTTTVPAPPNSPLSVVVSFRNTSTAIVTINTILSVSPGPCDGLVTVTRVGGGTNLQVALAVGEQAQYVFTSPGFAQTGMQTCVWTLMKADGGVESFSTV